jgi:hypothetical protein
MSTTGANRTFLDDLKVLLDRAGKEAPSEYIISHHVACALFYRAAARAFPDLRRAALTYAYLEDCTAKETRRFLTTNADVINRHKVGRLYRPFDPQTVDETRVLLKLGQPEHRSDVEGWFRHWVRAAAWYGEVARINKEQARVATDRCERAQKMAEGYRLRVVQESRENSPE